MSQNGSNENAHIFDDVFRTIFQKMPSLLIAVINEVFDTSYSEDEEIIQLRNEHKEIFGSITTDSIIKISNKIYHIECQSNKDSTMVIRMIEYDFSIALEDAFNKGRPYVIEFPESCVLYLRNDGAPSKLEMEVRLPNGESFTYETKVVKVQDYSKDMIFQKKLLMFLPFYVLRYEGTSEGLESDDEMLKLLLDEYEDIRKSLDMFIRESDQASLYTDLIKLIIRISDYIFEKSEKARKGVETIMGGQVLELQSEKDQKIGLERMMQLNSILISQGKLDELNKASSDLDYCQKLLIQFHLTDESENN
jgi:hypothetical protein